MARNENQVVMEGVTIRKRNFAGKVTDFNPSGNRTFLVLLDEDVASAMARDDWPVKRFKDGEDGVPGGSFLPVKVQYGDYPPQIFLRTTRNSTRLSEDEVDILDTADIINVDLIVNPSHWNVNGKTGIKAYLKSMYVTIEEDYLALKYSDIDENRMHNERINDQMED